jgi:Rad3-related DNA helicase
MGVGKKKKLAKDYTEKTDIHRDEEIQGETTLGTKDVESSLFLDCEKTDEDIVLNAGRRVMLLDLKKACVEVFVSSRQVVLVSATSSALLRERYQISSRKGRSMNAVVVDVGAFNNTFTVRVDG